MFKKMEGRQPSRQHILDLVNELDLTEQQIYKWFWDTKKKVEEDEQLAQEMGADISVILDEEGCQTVKAWRQSRETQGLDGKDGFGNPLTPLQIKTAIKIH